jgi:hypothetical protein
MSKKSAKSEESLTRKSCSKSDLKVAAVLEVVAA